MRFLGLQRPRRAADPDPDPTLDDRSLKTRLAVLSCLALFAVLAQPPAAARADRDASSDGSGMPARLAFTVQPRTEPLDAVAFVSDLAVGPDGTLYVADFDGCRVIRVAPDGTTLGAFGGCGIADGRFFAPTSVAVSPSGTVAVADEALGLVQLFDPAGRWLRGIDARDVLCHVPGAGCQPRRFDGPLALAYDPLGRLHVYDWLEDWPLRMLTWARFGPQGRLEGVLHESLGAAKLESSSLSFGPTGDLYTLRPSGGVTRLDPGQAGVTRLFWVGGGASDLVVDADGAFWTAGNHEIRRHDATGERAGVWALPGPPLSPALRSAGSESLRSLAMAPDGTIYTAGALRKSSQDASLGREVAPVPVVWRLRPDEPGAEPEPFWGRPATGAGAPPAYWTYAVAAGAGRVHLLESGRKHPWLETHNDWWRDVPPEVLTLDEAGDLVARWGRAGSEAGGFSVGGGGRGSALPRGPSDLALDVDGRVYVADTHGHRVQRFDRDGGFLGIAATMTKEPGSEPMSLALAADGTMAVLDAHSRVHRFAAGGTRVGPVLAKPPHIGPYSESRIVAFTRDKTALDQDWRDWDAQAEEEHVEVVRRTLDGTVVQRRRIPQRDGPGAIGVFDLAQGRQDGPLVLTTDESVLSGANVDGWSVQMRPATRPTGPMTSMRFALDEHDNAWVAHDERMDMHRERLRRRRLYRYVHHWPDTWRAQLFPDGHLGGPPLAITTTTALSLSPAIAAAAASVRFERVFGPEALKGEGSQGAATDDPAHPGGTFRIQLRVDGGARLWIDDALLVDQWHAEEVDIRLERLLPATWGHRVVIEARTAPLDGAVDLTIEALTPGQRIHLPIAHGLGRIADLPPPPPTPTPEPGYPGP